MALVKERRLRSWVRERARLAHPLCGHRKVFVMLQAYMDDSGSHESSHACVVAGYWGGVNRWSEFERKWKHVLDKYNVSEFHARAFWKRTPVGQGVGEYSGWSRQRLDKFLDSLLRVIEGTEIYPFAQGVVRSVWHSLTLRERQILNGGTPPNLENASRNPLFFPFQMCIAQVIQHCRPGLRIHFCLDDYSQTTPWAAVCYSQVRKVPIAEGFPHFSARFGELTFADSKEARPIQAADLLAYMANRHWSKAGGKPLFPLHPDCLRALKRMKTWADFQLYDRPKLQSIIPRRLDEKKV